MAAEKDPYQQFGLPLIQHRWPWSGKGKWIIWNWTLGQWDTIDGPKEKR